MNTVNRTDESVDLSSVSTVASLRTSWRQQWTAVLDGDFPWGAVISAPSRYGASQQQLIVYPPGITKTDRRWLRIWRGLPLWGGVAWLVLYTYLLHAVETWTALAISVSVCAVAGAIAFVMAAGTRCEVRTLHACVFTAVADPEMLKGQRRLQLLASTLRTADTHHRRGELSTVDYERIWWHIYDALAPDPEPPQQAQT